MAADWNSILVSPPATVGDVWDVGRYTPSPRQLIFQEYQLGTFVHFGLPTYATNDTEYGMVSTYRPGIADKNRFNPKELDAEQWVRTAKSFGARYLVFTAKHPDGFCLWPTQTTDYCVRNTPWKNGKGDVVREIADACRKHDMPFGIYCCPSDKIQNCFAKSQDNTYKLTGDRDVYYRIYLQQLRELLTNYGEVIQVWFDGADDPFGPNVTDANGRKIGQDSSYERGIVSLVRTLQPKASIFRWKTARSDIHGVGNEDGRSPYPVWNVVRKGEGVKSEWLAADAQGWYAFEADMPTRSVWIWQPNTDAQLRSVERLMQAYYDSIGIGANLLLNITPDTRGLIPEAEVKRMAEFGAELKRRLGSPIAETSSTKGWTEPGTLELGFNRGTRISHVELQEDIAYGQHVFKYALDFRVNGKWKETATGESISRRHIHRFTPAVAADGVRLRILEADAVPVMRRMAAYDVE
jgi:alpha-L-fucosidase